LLLSVVPNPSRVAVLVTPTSTTYRAILESVQGAAKKAGVKIVVVEASTPQEIENGFATIAREKASAVIVGSAPLFGVQRQQIVELAAKYRIPSMFGNREYAAAGGLLSFGGAITANYVRSATYVDKILKGAKPGDLPVEQPARFELVVNMKTAKALGLAIPQSLLLRADEVIQ
jgi:putative ABC transport system substrate-binding protein